MSILGSFLEVSISSEQLVKDLGFLEELGFQNLQVNEIWPHQYGVMGDGDVHIGLHNTPFESPGFTFVLPDLELNIRPLFNLDIDFIYVRTGDEQFHEAAFVDRSGLFVRVIEARTFSPTLTEEGRPSLLGQFQHLQIPASNGNDVFWGKLKSLEPEWHTAALELREDIQRPQIVFTAAIDELIMRGAKFGWPGFTVTPENHGLITTPLGFDFLIKDEPQDDA